MTANRQIIAEIRTTSLVTSEKGSWKYQDAYRIAEYRARETRDGRIVWESLARSGKYSLPQIARYGLTHEHRWSLHNRPVQRDEAVRKIGASRVRRLERAGFRFA